MTTVKRSLLITGLLAMVLAAGGAWAQYDVPINYPTIQAAVTAAPAGSTINVAAGTYNENLNINKSITINGPNAAISPNTGIRAAEAVLMPLVDTAITGTANGVTVVINGLTVDMALGVNDDDRTMTQIGQTGTSWTFENNIFKNAPECINGQWYISGTSTGMHFTLLDNLFTGNKSSNGIAIWNAGPTTLDIEDNVWENNEYTAMNINHAQGVIRNNIFRDTRTIDFGDPGYAWYYFQSGILMAGDMFDLEISNNQFSNVQYGVSMYANVDGVIDIANNTFDGVAISAVRASSAQTGSGDLDEVTVSGNAFLNYFGTGFMVGNVRVDGAVLNAEGNSWGSATGPFHATSNPGGAGGVVSDHVLFVPWTGRTTSTTSIAVTPYSPRDMDTAAAIGIDGDSAPGFTPGAFKAPNAVSKYGFDFAAILGRPVLIGELYSVTYFTKKSTLHTVSPGDWYFQMYTAPYVGGHGWYGDRINSEPYFSANLTETAGSWTQWATAEGANNRLRFFDSNLSLGSYTDGFLSDLTSNPSYMAQPIMAMFMGTGNPWAASFDGLLDGVVVELVSGETMSFNFVAGNGQATVTPATSGPINCSQSQTLTFNLTKTEGMPNVFGFNAVVRATGPVTWGSITDLAPFGGTTPLLSFDQGDGSYIISGTTVGFPTQPITALGTTPLFTIQYNATGTGTANITFDSFTLRDPNNAPIPAVATGASIVVDCTSPAAVTAITAAPAHNKVNVGWTHNGADAVSYEVYRGLWYDTSMAVSAYPEYDDLAGDVIPTRPLSRAAAAAPGSGWQLAGTKLVSEPRALEDSGPFAAGRGVYYYEVFAIDAANNASAVASMVARPRATNYWLGDVSGPFGNPTPNGLVEVPDMNVLGTYFGVSSVPLNSAGSAVDVGPTDNFSRVGIPTTDSAINFEDLMVFAMNFGVVSAAKVDVPVAKSVDLAWVQYDDGSQALRLVNGTGLKGVRVTANVPVTSVTAGSLLDEQSELTFLKNVGETLDASVAVMGVNTTFTGSGDLFVIAAGAAITAEDLTISARAIDNSRMDVTITEAAGGQATPRVFALNAAYPNPFNPMTKISFSLPEAQTVRMTVYGLDGRKVATLADGTFAAGLHEVVWTGRDDAGKGVASGTYIYRIDAGPYSDVRKMTLMK
jgi:hypothetical protein